MNADRALKSIINECWSRAGDANLGVTAWAKLAGLHVHTIERLAHGITKYPRFQTVVKMANAVGLEVSVTHHKTHNSRKAG